MNFLIQSYIHTAFAFLESHLLWIIWVVLFVLVALAQELRHLLQRQNDLRKINRKHKEDVQYLHGRIKEFADTNEFHSEEFTAIIKENQRLADEVVHRDELHGLTESRIQRIFQKGVSEGKQAQRDLSSERFRKSARNPEMQPELIRSVNLVSSLC